MYSEASVCMEVCLSACGLEGQCEDPCALPKVLLTPVGDVCSRHASLCLFLGGGVHPGAEWSAL